jgi:RNA polymerase sigma-70 factor (ECF subfamily)
MTNGTVSPDDAAVMRRIADGDEQALALLYDKWVQPVYALVVQILRDRDEAEDVVEETFWQVWQRASSYDFSRGAVHSWILTIGRSRALDRLRAKQRRKGESLAERSDIVALLVSPSDPSHDAEGRERRAVVLDALGQLPTEQRRALELAYYGGLSQAEIAEQLQEPLGTVKTRMRLGMLKLRDKLGILRETTA